MEKTAISHGQCNANGFQSLPQEKLWQKLQIIKSLIQPHDLMKFLANCHGCTYHPILCIFFHIHLCNNPHIMSNTLMHNPCYSNASACGKYMKLLSKPCHFSSSPQNLHATSFRSLPCMATPKNLFQHHLSALSHFWPLHSPW